jgi:hypothetical protein
MKEIPKGFMKALVALMLLLSVNSCAPGRQARTLESTPGEIQGTYTLLLYGGRYSDDLETLAILDREGDAYEFIIYAPEFDYLTKHDIPGKEALKEADEFVSFHHSFHRSILSRIVEAGGNTIGFEVRPLYYPIDVGFSDVIDVTYLIKDNKVTVKIRLRQEMERRLFEGDRPLIFKGR